MIKIINKEISYDAYCEVKPYYIISVGELAKKLYAFKSTRDSLVTENVGSGLSRILYSTYISYLPLEDWSYKLEKHEDERGAFVEFMKTKNSGQFSFFTA